jgi:hypothetical protein
MAIGPINYATGVDSPLQAFNGGFDTGAKIVNTQLDQRQRAIALDMQQSLTADARDVAANPTPQKIAGLALKYPQLSAEMKSSFDMMNTAQQDARLKAAIPIYAAVSSNNPDVAVQMLSAQADGYENSGDKAGAMQSRTMAQLVKDHPEQAKVLLGIGLAGAMGPDKFAETMAKLGGETRANELQPAAVVKAGGEAQVFAAKGANAPVVEGAGAKAAVADAGIKTAQADVAPETAALTNEKTKADIKQMSAKEKLDIDTLTTNTQLKLQELNLQYGAPPADVAKMRDESALASVAADTKADKYASFANKYEQYSNSVAGIAGNNIAKLIQTNVGFQSDWTDARNEYNRLRASGIADNLPPQVTRLTDSDLKVFGAGIPKDTDDPKRAVAFLRSMATLQKVAAVQEDAKAQWAAANHMGGFGPAKSDLTINGIQVPQGMPFPAFLRQYTTNQMENYVKKTATDTVNSRGYMSYVTAPTNTTTTPGAM